MSCRGVASRVERWNMCGEGHAYIFGLVLRFKVGFKIVCFCYNLQGQECSCIFLFLFFFEG